MRTPHTSSTPWAAYAICLVSTIALGVFLVKQPSGQVVTPENSPSPEVSATPSPSASASATASASPTPSLSPSPSASVSNELPAAVTEFYSAYQKQRAVDVFAQFTEPETDGDRDLLSLLRDGKDLQGIPGGPTLFQTASVTVTITKVSLVNTAGTKVEVEETIQAEETFEVRKRSFIMKDGKIDMYTKEGNDGKYSGFFN